jgi:hypothetical protein
METDYHYYAIFKPARLAGFNPGDAFTLSCSGFHSLPTPPHHASGWEKRQRTTGNDIVKKEPAAHLFQTIASYNGAEANRHHETASGIEP